MESGALSFGQVAAAYDAIRPTYPREAIVWALGPQPRRVVDLGAGTGILTRVLLAAGHEVVPVEPDERMRARISAPAPLAGSAEDIPLPDGSVDAVLAGQAYHWFDKPRAHPEIARVLRSGGVFAPIWNVRDESVPWLAELTRVASLGGRSRNDAAGLDELGDAFTAVERADFRHTVTHTPDSLVALVRSRSYYLTATPEQRVALEAGVRDLVAGRETIELPYVTHTYRTVKR